MSRITENKKRIVANFLWLSIVQVVNYVLPMLTVPYLIVTIGVKNIGVIAFASAVCSYFLIVTDYGFNLTATKDVAERKGDIVSINKIFTTVFFVKSALSIICFLCLFALVELVPQINKESILFFSTFFIVFGQVVMPIWFFQGMEDMKYITYINVAIKGISTVSIFLFIKEASDYIYVPLIYSISSILAGIVGVAIVFYKYKVRISLISFVELKRSMMDGWHIFCANLYSVLYRNSFPLLMGLFSTEYALGIYSVAERITKIIQSMQSVAGNAIYPHLIKKYKSNRDSFFLLKSKYQNKVFFVYFFLMISVIFSSVFIAHFLDENHSERLAINIILQAPVILFGGLSYFYGVLGLVALGLGSLFSKAVLKTGIITTLVSPLIIHFYSDIGGSLCFLGAEVVLFVLLCIDVRNLERNRASHNT